MGLQDQEKARWIGGSVKGKVGGKGIQTKAWN
jgi:hypothetical protein